MIDVVIPCYNDSYYLPKAVGSVLAQTYDEWQLWIINDGSTDDTEELIIRLENVDPQRIHGLSLAENVGSGRARNIAVGHGSGEFLAFVDADDLISADFLRATLDAIGAAAYCYTDYWQFLEAEGIVLEQSQRDYDNGWLKVPREEAWAPLMTSLVRRRAFEAAGGFDERSPASENWVFFVRLAAAGFRGTRLARRLFWHRIGKVHSEHRWARVSGDYQLDRAMIESEFPEFFGGGQ